MMAAPCGIWEPVVLSPPVLTTAEGSKGER
jgi:hypothetical protein